MKFAQFTALGVIAAAAAVSAQETRQLDAHEHGVAELDIAFDGAQIAMALRAPGADIVGFEYAATSDADRAAIAAALAVLSDPLALFVLPQAAGCRVVEAMAELESEAHDEDPDDHEDHDDHDDHADHEEDKDPDHAHEDDHDEAAKAGEGHTEFHADYLLSCENPDQVTQIEFGYFEIFPNALEVEVQVISEAGAGAAEVERDAPTLDLRDLF